MRRSQFAAGGVAFALLIGGQIFAQSRDAPEPPADSMAARAKILAAKELVAADTRKVLNLQATARREKDVIKLTCVNDAMITVKAEANIFDDASAEFEAVADAEWQVAFAAAQKAATSVGKAREEAERCVGEAELTSDSNASVVAPDVSDDPTQGTPFDTDVVEPPAYASPFR